MLLLLLAIVCVLLPSVGCVLLRRAAFDTRDPFNDRLQALGLLGSHFGQVGVTPVSYDYVVVGGGTAGLTVANRLAKTSSVAVVEAGGFYEIQNANLTQVPANDVCYLGKNPVWNNPLIDWLQYTTKQPALNDESVLFSSGHTLGGGSARNFMWYHRGNLQSYQDWAKITGDPSWEFGRFEQYMKSPVEFTPPPRNAYPANNTPEYHNGDYDPNGGPLQVSYPRFMAPSAAYIGAGFTELGLDRLPGMTNGNLMGWASIACTIDPTTQTRSTSETSMLRDSIRKSFNLVIFTQALAKRVLFDKPKKATGVEVQVGSMASGSVTFNISANKEVIVSAGAFRSPQLLMASGIGPSETLRAHGIPVVAKSEGVGQNLMDHVWVAVTRETNVHTLASLADPDYFVEQQKDYVESRTGAFTNPAGTLIAFEKLPDKYLCTSTRSALEKKYGGDWPHIEYFHQDAYSSTNEDYLLQAPDTKNYTAVTAAVIAPFSRGNVTISSNSTLHHPIVNPNWLSDPRDMEVLIAGFKRVRDMFATAAVKPMLVGDEVYPGANVTTDAEIAAVIRRSAHTVFHAAGTCRMGKRRDPMAVLDSQARVSGVQGLRVVDASAFPVIPAGHPQGTVYGFAEKIARKILGESRLGEDEGLFTQGKG